jgi:hypothetical protein
VKSTATTPRTINKAMPTRILGSAPSVGTADTGEDTAALTVDERGMVCDCNHAGELLFKYRRGELVWRHFSMLLPQLADVDLMPNGQPNPRLRYLCRIGCQLQAVNRDGERFACDLFLNAIDGTGHGRLRLIVRPAGDHAH